MLEKAYLVGPFVQLAQAQPWWVLVPASIAGVLVGIVVITALCRLLFMLVYVATQTCTDVIVKGSEWLVRTVATLSAGIVSLLGQVLFLMFWFLSRPFVALYDYLRDKAVTFSDAAASRIERERELRRLWADSRHLYRTWAEFRRAFEQQSAGEDTKHDGKRDEADRDAAAFARACRLLGLPESGDFTKSEFNARFRERMQHGHSDKDGSDELATELNLAREVIRRAKGWR